MAKKKKDSKKLDILKEVKTKLDRIEETVNLNGLDTTILACIFFFIALYLTLIFSGNLKNLSPYILIGFFYLAIPIFSFLLIIFPYIESIIYKENKLFEKATILTYSFSMVFFTVLIWLIILIGYVVDILGITIEPNILQYAIPILSLSCLVGAVLISFKKIRPKFLKYFEENYPNLYSDKGKDKKELSNNQKSSKKEIKEKYNDKGILIFLGIVSIISLTVLIFTASPSFLNENTDYKTYNFDLSVTPDGSYPWEQKSTIATLNFYDYHFDFEQNPPRGILTFSTSPAKYIFFESSENITIEEINIKNDSFYHGEFLQEGRDYFINLTNAGKGGPLIENIGNNSKDITVEIIFQIDSLKPNGQFFFNTGADYIYADRPFVDLKLGKYSCYPVCISNKIQVRDEFKINKNEEINLYIVNNSNIKGSENQIIGTASFSLNTYDKTNRFWKNLLFGLAISFLASSLVLLADKIFKH